MRRICVLKLFKLPLIRGFYALAWRRQLRLRIHSWNAGYKLLVLLRRPSTFMDNSAFGKTAEWASNYIPLLLLYILHFCITIKTRNHLTFFFKKSRYISISYIWLAKSHKSNFLLFIKFNISLVQISMAPYPISKKVNCLWSLTEN